MQAIESTRCEGRAHAVVIRAEMMHAASRTIMAALTVAKRAPAHAHLAYRAETYSAAILRGQGCIAWGSLLRELSEAIVASEGPCDEIMDLYLAVYNVWEVSQ